MQACIRERVLVVNRTFHKALLIAQLTTFYTPWVKKGCHPNHGYNFANSWSIFKILSLLQRALNFQQNQY